MSKYCGKHDIEMKASPGVGGAVDYYCPYCAEYEAKKILGRVPKADDKTVVYGGEHLGWCAEYVKVRDTLKAIIAHWDEFGPEHGFAEIIDRVGRPVIGN